MAKFDLTLSLSYRDDGALSAGWRYATALFDAGTVERYAGLPAPVADGDGGGRRAGGCAADPQRGRARLELVYGWNETKAEYPSGARACTVVRRTGGADAWGVGGGV